MVMTHTPGPLSDRKLPYIVDDVTKYIAKYGCTIADALNDFEFDEGGPALSDAERIQIRAAIAKAKGGAG